jgi:hypothetical protein
MDDGRLWMERGWITLRGNYHNVTLFHVRSIASLGSGLDSCHTQSNRCVDPTWRGPAEIGTLRVCADDTRKSSGNSWSSW